MLTTGERVRHLIHGEGPGAERVRVILLAAGVCAPLLYVVMNVLGALRFHGYSTVSQTVSELSAIGAPSRPLWLGLSIGYGILLVAFGCGVWLSAGAGRAGRIAGAVLVLDALIGFAWPPMHLRGAGTSLTDTMHIVFTVVAIPLMLVAMGAGATLLGRAFLVYSLVSLAILLAFGIATGLDGPRIPKNEPTPGVGIVERICIGAFLLWLAVFAMGLLRRTSRRSASGAPP
jgi:hypothetical protein